MELRHLRYFIAVAEAGSLTVAAEQSLHTSQPSLSRQIRDLENEVGAQLLTRRARGVEVTPAGRAVLPHPRGGLGRFSSTPAWCDGGWSRLLKVLAGQHIPPSRASLWAF